MALSRCSSAIRRNSRLLETAPISSTYILSRSAQTRRVLVRNASTQKRNPEKNEAGQRDVTTKTAENNEAGQRDFKGQLWDSTYQRIRRERKERDGFAEMQQWGNPRLMNTLGIVGGTRIK